MNRTWLIGAAAVIIVGVAAFFAGQQVGGGGASAGAVTVAALKATPADQLQTVLQQYFQENGGAFGGRARTGTGSGAGGVRPDGGGFVNGTVVAKDNTSITVKLPGGSTKNVLYSGSTTVSKSSEGKIGDVSTGATVLVTGSSNTDGSVTATRIQIVPAGQTAGLPGPPGGGASAGATATTTGS